MRAVTLGDVLASRANEAELHRLLTTIESIDWSGAVFRYTKPTDTAYDDSNRAAPGDFVWYDPWKQERLESYEVAQARLREKPAIPADERRGYVHLDEQGHGNEGGDSMAVDSGVGISGTDPGASGSAIDPVVNDSSAVPGGNEGSGVVPVSVGTGSVPTRTGRTIGVGPSGGSSVSRNGCSRLSSS